MHSLPFKMKLLLILAENSWKTEITLLEIKLNLEIVSDILWVILDTTIWLKNIVPVIHKESKNKN